MKSNLYKIPGWMDKVAWQKLNKIEDLKEHWQTIADEVDSAVKSGTGMADLQHKYKCHMTVLNMIWLNIKYGLGNLT